MYRKLFRFLANIPTTLPPSPLLPRLNRSTQHTPKVSPLAFSPSERLLELVCRAEDLPELILFEETVLKIYENDPARRERYFIASHPEVTPSHEDIWKFSVECNVYIANMHSAIRKLKKELDTVLKDLKTTWLNEREAWVGKALEAAATRAADCEEEWEEDLWMERLQKIDELVKELYVRN